MEEKDKLLLQYQNHYDGQKLQQQDAPSSSSSGVHVTDVIEGKPSVDNVDLEEEDDWGDDAWGDN